MLQKMATTGVGLENVYDQTLRRIREQRSDRSRLGMEVLMWVSHSKRPLRIDEFYHALAIEMGTSNLDHENIPPQDTVLGSCLGLVTVDKETSTFRLVHYTLQEYLSLPGILPNAHKTLAQSCLTYLNYEQVKRLPANQISAVGNLPFLEYSSLYWGNHAKMELSDHATALALELLNRYGDHISATLLCDQIQISHPDPLSHLDLFSYHLFPGLHCASYLGIDELVVPLIRMEGCDINQADCMGFTPLMWASLQGNEKAVNLLLNWGNASPNIPGNRGRTPLHLASGEGHEGVVKLLLSRYYYDTPDLQDSYGQTPLCNASRNGHAKVVKLLLAKNGISPDQPNNDGRTPLWWASSNGHEGVVRLLLARDGVNPNLTDSHGQTPLAAASMRGHMDIVALLQPRTTAVSGID